MIVGKGGQGRAAATPNRTSNLHYILTRNFRTLELFCWMLPGRWLKKVEINKISEYRFRYQYLRFDIQ